MPEAALSVSISTVHPLDREKTHFYDQPPRDAGRGVVHHLGIRTDNLEALMAHMKSKGFEFRKEMTIFGPLKYVMAAGPDGILLELFETDAF